MSKRTEEKSLEFYQYIRVYISILSLDRHQMAGFQVLEEGTQSTKEILLQ